MIKTNMIYTMTMYSQPLQCCLPADTEAKQNFTFQTTLDK